MQVCCIFGVENVVFCLFFSLFYGVIFKAESFENHISSGAEAQSLSYKRFP